MDYKSILVHLDRGAKSAARLEIGFALAEAFREAAKSGETGHQFLY